ncbi:o-succinylbenzoate synthase [Synechococcus sp. Nb3U1]|uniref:o-succinylbenzoate synthase n=1 Tax=Synechococcus sp. Nb3U1 TaxID=1914529 RepID=UPI001F419E0A|nr:o-succinylbenzoate synthase [Synechococcus sp. Nb3U1]MCF2971887.1 o-succinylbenzoate synthase [Synechococcus sp. Nb3U1]
MLTDLKFEFRPYRRPFRQPLRTHHGLWLIREGILIRLTDIGTGIHRYGEIAPIPWFGSETLEQALQFCQQLPRQISKAYLFGIPEELPACQFGFESAGLALQDPDGFNRDLSGLAFCGLLPAGEAALTQAGSLYEQGYRVLKWKVGVRERQQEWQVLTDLIKHLPQDCHLRLDANGGLTGLEAHEWLALCDQVNHHSPGRIEFLEQPLSPNHSTELVHLSQQYQTPIALDESVAQLSQLKRLHQSGWVGILVVKPALLGSCLALQDYRDQHPELDLVFSSALETPIGAWHGIAWAGSLQPKTACPRALGWGVGSFFPTWDPLTLLRASAEERETLLQEVWDFYG